MDVPALSDPNAVANAAVNLIADVAKTTGADRFKLAILRTGASGYPEAFATFADAKVDQIAHPEEWLGRIGGGGTYGLKVYHVSDAAKQIGAQLQVRIGGAPRRDPIDTSVVNELDWRGPQEMTYPLPPRRNGAGATANTTPFIGIPGAESGAFPGGGIGAPPRNGDQHTSGVASSSPFERERASIDRDREELRRQTLEVEKERHRAEIAAQQQRTDFEIARLRTEIAAAAKPASSGPSEITLLLVEMQKQAQAAADRQAEAQRRADERFAAMLAEQSKVTQAQLAAAQELSTKLMTTLLTKPSIDPVMEKLLSRDADAASTTVKVVQQMADATGSVVQMMVGALHAISELNAPEQEPGWLKGMREAAKVVAAMSMQQAATVAPVALPAPAPAPAPRASFGDAPVPAPPAPAQAPAPPAATPIDAFSRVIAAIKARHDPIKVATYFLDNAEDPSIQSKLAATGGNPLQAFAPYLNDWIKADPQNMQYVRTLILTVQKQYEERLKAAGAPVEEEPEETPPAPESTPGTPDPTTLE